MENIFVGVQCCNGSILRHILPVPENILEILAVNNKHSLFCIDVSTFPYKQHPTPDTKMQWRKGNLF